MTLQSTTATIPTALPSTALAGGLTPVENTGASFLTASYEVERAR